MVISGDQLFGCTTLYDCLVGKIPGVIYNGGKIYRIRNLARSQLVKKDSYQDSNDPMAIIVDGVLFSQKSDNNVLTDLNIADVNSIEVLTTGGYLAQYGSGASGGALVITTKRGGENTGSYQTSAQPAGLIAFRFRGYHVARTFYTPKYDHPKTDTEPFDFRAAIYWNPNVTIDEKGKASISWFNADAKGTYRVVVEGIDNDGNVGRIVYRYNVE
jgi:outer membrane receptor protein involved in Fe transport